MRTPAFAYSGSGAAASCADSWKLCQKLQASVARSSRRVGTSMQKSEGAGGTQENTVCPSKRLHLASNPSHVDKKKNPFKKMLLKHNLYCLTRAEHFCMMLLRIC